MKSKISVIIPVYNAEKFIAKCLDSIINQTFRDIEIICVDDCSSDNSKRILQEYALKDSRIKTIFFDKNKKQGAARNAALDIANGKYVTFVDSDDYIEPAMLKKMYEKAEKNYCDLVITNVENYVNTEDENTLKLKKKLDSSYRDKNFKTGFYFYNFNQRDLRVGPVAKLYKREILEDNHIRFPENIMQEDEAFYWFVMPFVNNLYLLDEPLYKRLIHTNSTMYYLDYENKFVYDHAKIVKLIKNFLKERKLYDLYKHKFIYYAQAVINSKTDEKLRRNYFLKISQFCPEVLSVVYIELKSELALLREIYFNKNVVLWGASLFLERVLKKYNVKTQNIKGIVDKNSKRWGETLCDYEISSPDKLSKLGADNVVFSIQNNASSIYRQVKNYMDANYPKINLVKNIFDSNVNFRQQRITPQLGFENIEFHVAEHCNLSCKSCNHFSSLAEKKFADPRAFAKDVKRLAELSNKKIKRFCLLGGEPLLHPQINEFMKICRENLADTRVAILTNGILLTSMPEEFWHACHDYNIVVNVTKYPINLDFGKNEELAKQYDVEFEYFTSSAEIVKTSDHYPLDLSGKQNAKKCFKNCQLANHCIFLKNGKLYTCAIAPNIEHFNKFFGKNLALENKDGIDIYKAKSEKQILTFLAKPIPFCKYCNVQGRVFGKNQWGISKKSIEEWT